MASVDELLAKRGGPSATLPADRGLDERLDELTVAVRQLTSRSDTSAELLKAVERERDRYRADAAAAREAALRLNSAAQEVDGAVRQLLEVLALQREALAQLLIPGSPQDLEP